MLRLTLLLFLFVGSYAYIVHQPHKESIRINLKVTNEAVPANITSANRIVWGVEATPHAYPFVVRLDIEYETGEWGSCGGQLISRNYVLTASHCMFHPQSKARVSRVVVYLGDHDARIPEAGEQMIQSQYVLVHQRYSNLVYDISLVYLPQGVQLSQTIQPVCLPSSGRQFYNWEARAIGWGATESAQNSPVLKQVDVPIINDGPCNNVYSGLFRSDIMICTGFKGDSKGSTCYGDSGGPLFVNENNRFTVVGLTSYGPTAGCGIYGTVFTKISSFIDWLRNNMQDGGQFCTH